MMILLKRFVYILVVQLVALTNCTIQAQTSGMEVAYLQTDRTTYIAGESVFYKLYVLDATSKKCSVNSKVGYVILRAANLNSSLKIRVKIDAGISSGRIVLPDTLASGVYQIVAFTVAMKNFGEEHFFHKEIVIANRFDKELNLKLMSSVTSDSNANKTSDIDQIIKTEKKVYGVREKVSVSLNKLNFKGNVAVTVFEEPQILNKDKSIVETISTLVVAPTDKNIVNGYLTENKEKILRGNVIDITTKKIVTDATVLLSCIDTIPNLQYAKTNSNGFFQLLLNDYYNGKELFLTIKDMPANQHWKIVIEDEFAQSEKWSPVLLNDNNATKDYLLKSQQIVYINKSYSSINDVFDKPVADTKLICPMVYHCNVRTVYPSQFVPLDDFQEIAVEILPLVNISKTNGKYRAQMLNTSTKLYYNDDPAIFLDGVFVDDINKIIGLRSEQIKKIDMIETERIFGDIVFPGIISIMSVSNEILHSTPASHSIRIKNDNINSGKSFEAINPNTNQNKNIPYFKQLLYWNPDLEMNGTAPTGFQFYTSDNTANFIIKVEGISNDGIPITASTGIQVINQNNTAEK